MPKWWRVGRLPWEPNPVQVAPGRSRLRISDDSQEDRGLRFPTGTSFTSKGRRLRSSRLEGNAVLGGQVRRRSGADGAVGCFGVSVQETREKPVSKGTGRGDGLRYRLMRRLD